MEAQESAQSAQAEVQPSSVGDSQEVVNDWEGAQEVFEEPELAEVEPQAEGQDLSQLEQTNVPEYLKLDDLRVPRKYKQEVEKFIKDRVVSSIEKQNQESAKALEQEAGQHKELSRGLLQVFNEIAENPERAGYYIDKYGDQLGIDRAHAKKFMRQVQQEQQQQQHQVVQRNQGIEEIAARYMDKMISEQDPRVFMAYQVQMLNDALGATQSNTLNQVGQLLKMYHEQYVDPDKKLIKQFQERSEIEHQTQVFNASSNSWNSALTNLKTKYPDIDSYQGKIRDYLKNNRNFNAARNALNGEPNDVDGRRELIEQAYIVLSKQNPPKKPLNPGIKPSSKHIETVKKGGSDWDEIYSDPDLGWERRA